MRFVTPFKVKWTYTWEIFCWYNYHFTLLKILRIKGTFLKRTITWSEVAVNSVVAEAQSTYIRIFFKTHLFPRFGLAFTRSRRHFSHQKRRFSKMVSWGDLFENFVFMLSRMDGWKQSFSKTLTSQHLFISYKSISTDLWGSRKGILLICFRISNITAYSWGRDTFKNAHRVNADIFIHKKDAFPKISGCVWTRPQLLLDLSINPW